MNKPKAIRVAIGLINSKISFYILISLITTYVLFERPGIAFLDGVADGVFELVKLENPYGHDPNYSISFVLTRFFFLIFRSFLLVYFMIKRYKLAFWLVFIFDTMLALASLSIPVFGIIILTIMLTKDARGYFRKTKPVVQ